jgi:hypothetical protein
MRFFLIFLFYMPVFYTTTVSYNYFTVSAALTQAVSVQVSYIIDSLEIVNFIHFKLRAAIGLKVNFSLGFLLM